MCLCPFASTHLTEESKKMCGPLLGSYANIFYTWLHIYAKSSRHFCINMQKWPSGRLCFPRILGCSGRLLGPFSAFMELRMVIISDKATLSALILPLVSGSLGQPVLGSGEALLGLMMVARVLMTIISHFSVVGKGAEIAVFALSFSFTAFKAPHAGSRMAVFVYLCSSLIFRNNANIFYIVGAVPNGVSIYAGNYP